MRVIRICGAAAFLTLAMSGCRDAKSEFYFNSLKEMERSGYRGEPLPDRRVEELKAGIRRYQAEVEKKVHDTQQLGIYYKMLGSRLMDLGMYGEAYRYLQEAVKIDTENPALFTLAAISAARLGQATVEEKEKEEWRRRAEALYKRALELDPESRNALYGFAVFLVFERGRPADAEPYLSRLLARESKNIEAMFLMANVYYQTGRLPEAIELYDRIIRSTGVESERRKAEELKNRLQEEQYGRK